MAKKMSLKDAALTLIFESRRARYSNASVQRTVKALRTIGLDGDDLVAVLASMEMCRYDSGEPYHSYIKRTW